MLHASVAQLPPTMKGRNFLLRGTTPLEHRFIGNAKIFNEQEKAQLLKQYDQHFPFYQAVSSVYQRNHQLDAITRMQDVDMHTWLPGDLLLNADRTSMASGLELRTPFIDRQVFSVAQKIPTNLRVTHGTTKYILRETAKAFLPTGIVDRQKLGFPIPIRVWLKNELHDWAVDMIQTANVDQWLDKAYCLQLLDEHCQGRRDNSRKIWTILTFITWHRVFVERTAS
jgi:asparagine synthase (glutamine-hydrolysing)